MKRLPEPIYVIRGDSCPYCGRTEAHYCGSRRFSVDCFLMLLGFLAVGFFFAISYWR